MTDTERGLRRFLLAAAAVTYVGGAVELVLVEHWGEWQQWIAFVLIVVGLAAVAWAARAPSPRSLGSLKVFGLVVGIGAIAGVALHGWGNAAFAREIDPGLTALGTVAEAATGGNPLFAPGMLALAAALGVAAAWRHPLAS
ncbi:hypothetical protein [Rubrivirga sp. IMCC45206]|uniref:hypothetical protein n=1 Tax=Rubrivirga sp. IMCC45206 TaxID=3391614 RepID=UPI00398FF46C